MTGELETPSPGASAARPDLAARVADRALAQRPRDAASLQAAVEAALSVLDGRGGSRQESAQRRDRARQVALLAELVGRGSASPLDALTSHLRLVLRAPAGNPLWEDLRRLTTLLQELEAVRRRQQRQVRLPGRRREAASAEVRGTDKVIATALQAFREAWRGAPS